MLSLFIMPPNMITKWSAVIAACIASVALATDVSLTNKPTSKPTFPEWNGAGCPRKWMDGSSYEPKDMVEIDGVVYECSKQELLFIDQLCGLISYKPGDSLHWEVAWTRVGSCTGTIRPTSSPVYVDLTYIGGCPPEFSEHIKYETGDTIQVNGIVMQCKEWPHGAFCNSVEPFGSTHEMAWLTLGYCDGTISPTTSPVFDSLPDHQGCPDPYNPSAKYIADDEVSTQVNDVFSVVWKCASSIHLSRFCDRFEPGNVSNLGWTAVGHCYGTMSPTTAPNFVQLVEYGAGCPDEYDADSRYVSGDIVSYPRAPNRILVYECKKWPHTAYCNAGQLFAPGELNEALGWEIKGWCDGTLAPTSSPILWTGACEDKPWSIRDVLKYEQGDRVRKSNKIYECRAWPYSLWCTNAYYEPEISQNWKEAWLYVGECQAIDVISATIEGTLTLPIEERRSLISVGGLNKIEMEDLIVSTHEIVEDVVCANLPQGYICTVDILSVNDQPVTRRLRLSSERKLAEVLVFGWVAQLTFPQDKFPTEELVAEVSSLVSNNLNAAVADSSIGTAFVSKASTHAVRSMNFGMASVETEPASVEVKKMPSTLKRSGGASCSEDSQCTSNNCAYGGGNCTWWKKCCETTLKGGGERCEKNQECASNICYKPNRYSSSRCKPATTKPTQRPTLPPTANPTKRPTPPPTAKPTKRPTVSPTANPTKRPTPSPTTKPTRHTEFCARFNDPSDLQGFARCPGRGDFDNNIIVRHSTNLGWRSTDDPINPLTNDTYLHLQDGPGADWLVGASLACGYSPDYTGNWSRFFYHELCFDVNLFYDGCYEGNPQCTTNADGERFINVFPSLYIRSPSGYVAIFTAHDFMTDQKGSSPGWRRICAPIGPLDSSGNLPSNKFGYWQMTSSYILNGRHFSGCPEYCPASDNSTWPTLLFDVTAIILEVDFTDDVAERVGYDNICMEALKDPPTNAPSSSPSQSPTMECKSMHVTINSPLNNDNYLKDVFSDFQKTGPDTFCYNEVLASVTDGPTTPQLLVMFRENFVEHKCKVYASLSSARSDCDNPERKYLQKEGLYKPGACVTFRLLYEDDALGQIVASSHFDPIEVIGISGTTIYGFYPNPNSPGGAWLRKPTVWGDALDGSLSAEPKPSNVAAGVSGLSSNARIGRLSPTSNIYGISTDGRVLFLWDQVGVAVHSAPLDLGSELTEIQAIGGVDNGYARGVFAINDRDHIYNVYWDGTWKAKELPLDYHVGTSVSAWFGNYNDQAYILYGHQPYLSCQNCNAWYSLYRLDFVGGEGRHSPTRIAYGEVSYSNRNNLCSTDFPSVSPSITLSPSLSSKPTSSTSPSSPPTAKPTKRPTVSPTANPTKRPMPPTPLPTAKPTRHTEFCSGFNDPSDLQGFAPCPGDFANIIVRHSTNLGWRSTDDPINPLTNDTYLHLEDRSYESLACGTSPDYTGNWSRFFCHELCFDVNLFYDGCNEDHTKQCTTNADGERFINVYPKLYIQGGAPNYYLADFTAHDFMTDQKGSSPGWRRICAPIGPLDSSGNLPSNEFGYWKMTSPLNILSGRQFSGLPASDNSTWPTLLFDVTAIVLLVDFTGNQAERVGYDNICMEASKDPCFISSDKPSSNPTNTLSSSPSRSPTVD
ncbi:hypothetical protein ACHAXN_004984 [Cyclotella atomus]